MMREKTGDPIQCPGGAAVCPAEPAGPAAGRLDRRRQHHPVLLCIPIVAGGPADLCTLLRPCAGPLRLQPLHEQYAAAIAGGAGLGGKVRQPQPADDHSGNGSGDGTGAVHLLPRYGAAGSQRCGVHDDRAELLHRDAPGRHPSDHAAGGGPVSGQRGGGRSLRERQHLPDDPHRGRSLRHRVRFLSGPCQKEMIPIKKMRKPYDFRIFFTPAYGAFDTPWATWKMLF